MPLNRDSGFYTHFVAAVEATLQVTLSVVGQIVIYDLFINVEDVNTHHLEGHQWRYNL